MPVSDTKIVPSGDRFDIDFDNSVDLKLHVRGGAFLYDQKFKSAAKVVLTLTASSTNYVEVDDGGVISSNTTGFTAGSTQLYIVTTGATGVTGIKDCRATAWTEATLDGDSAKTVADKNVVGGIAVLHRIDVAAGANADTDVVVTHKTRVVDAWVVLRGAGVASAVMTVKNGASAITNGIAASGADQTVTRAGTIDDAQHEIAAGGTLRVTGSGGASMPACTVYVLGVRVA